MASHSPTPWTAIRSTVGDAAINQILDADGYEVNARGFGLSGSERAAANSDLMFRAVNAHDDLVAALKSALSQLESYENVISGESFNDTQINAALAKAEA